MGEESPLYSTRAFRSCFSHHPVDCDKEEDRLQYAAVVHSGFYWKSFSDDVAEDDTAFKVVVEHLKKVDNLRGVFHMLMLGGSSINILGAS